MNKHDRTIFKKRHGNDKHKIQDNGYLLEGRGHFKGSYNNILSWVLVHECLLLFLLDFFKSSTRHVNFLKNYLSN